MNSRQKETFELIKNTLDHEATQCDRTAMKDFLEAIAEEVINRHQAIEKSEK